MTTEHGWKRGPWAGRATLAAFMGFAFAVGAFALAARRADAGAAPARWWEADPPRILVARCNYRYRPEPPTSEQLSEIREKGFNVFGGRWFQFDRPEVERVLRILRWRFPGLYYAPWIRGTLANPDDEDKMIVWANGQVQPLYGPLAPELWEFLEEWVGYYAELSANDPLVGVMLDFENYAENKQNNLYFVAYDIYSLRLYAEARGVAGPPEGLRPQEARAWFENQPADDWAGYEEWFREQFRQRCRRLRELADKHNPQFLFMVYLNPGLTREIAAAEWGTEQAPYVVAGVDYGRPYPYLSERLNLYAVEQRVRSRVEAWRQREDVNALVLGGPLPGYRGSDPEFSGKKATIIARESDGYWVWYSRAHPDELHAETMDWYSRANQDILAGTYALADLPRQGPEPGPAIEPRRPDDAQVAVHGDMRSAVRRFLEGQDGFEPHVLVGSTPEYLRQFGMVILQGASVPERGAEEFRTLLREYVRQGGALVLAYDTVGAIGSPFPEIVAGAQAPNAVAATGSAHAQHDDIVHHRTRRIVAENPAFLAGIENRTYSAHYQFHQPMQAGPEGTVVTENRFGMPVIVVGAYGEGRVAAMGDFLGRRRSPTGDEAQTFLNVFRFLTSNGEEE